MTGLTIGTLFGSEATTETVNPNSYFLQCFIRRVSQSQCWRMSHSLTMSGGREDHVKFGFNAQKFPSLCVKDS